MMKLPKELRTAINRTAHSAGLMHSEAVRRKLKAEAERYITAGGSAEKFLARLEKLAATASKERQ